MHFANHQELLEGQLAMAGPLAFSLKEWIEERTGDFDFSGQEKEADYEVEDWNITE